MTVPPPPQGGHLWVLTACGVLIYWRPQQSYHISLCPLGTAECDRQRAVSSCKWGCGSWSTPSWSLSPISTKFPRSSSGKAPGGGPVNSSHQLSASLWMTPAIQVAPVLSRLSSEPEWQSPTSESQLSTCGVKSHPAHHWSVRYNWVLLLKLLSFGVVYYNSTN